MKLKSTLASVLVVSATTGASAAEILQAPRLNAAGFINGCLNVCVKQYDTGYNISGCTLEVQMKDSGDDDSGYATIAAVGVTSLQNYDFNAYHGRVLTLVTNFVGEATLRMRCVSNELESAWTEIGALSAYVNVEGRSIGTTTQFANAVDGNMFTMVDDDTNPWIGWKYDEPVRIRAVRFFARPDLLWRFAGAKIEYASDDSFSDAVTVYTADTSLINNKAVSEVVFAEPVTANCIRVTSGTSSAARLSVCEFEVVPADAPWKPALHPIAHSDVTNFWPVLTWELPDEIAATTATVWRATAETGPYRAVADELPASREMTWTDTSAKVGVLYFYRVSADCNSPLFPDESVTSSVASFRRYRRLDRDWLNESVLTGCSIMPQTNGVAFANGIKSAFDGKAGTFSDFNDAPNKFGPVGLKFTTNVWVGGFGYICRNDNSCYTRIMNAACFSAEADDVQLLGKIQRSERITRASMDQTFYYEPNTSIPAAGAPCWFLWGVQFGYRNSMETFYCNIAELALFGWTQRDIDDAAILTAPTDVAVERSGGGLSVRVSWTAGTSATNYRVERRVRNSSEEWSAVATVPADGILACDDDGIVQGFWEYRVVSVASDGEEVASVNVTYAYYAPGGGSGLAGSLYYPYVATNAALCSPVAHYGLPAGAVDFSLEDGAEWISGTDIRGNVRLLWRGTIAIPFSGTYQFSLSTGGGGAVHINGISVLNDWSAGEKRLGGSITLDAGEYPIEVDAALLENLPQTCVLSWGGTVPSEVVPASQLRPASESLLEFDGWNVRQFAGGKLGHVAVDGGGYAIYGPNEQPRGAQCSKCVCHCKVAGFAGVFHADIGAGHRHTEWAGRHHGADARRRALCRLLQF